VFLEIIGFDGYLYYEKVLLSSEEVNLMKCGVLVGSAVTLRSSAQEMVERLRSLLRADLRFHDESSSYGPHSIHAFAAKFPPQLPNFFIRELTEPGQVVLDPMCGSGTTLVEAMTLERQGIGVDIDPLAILQTKVKTAPLDSRSAEIAVKEVASKAASLMFDRDFLAEEISRRFDPVTQSFIDYWFLKKAQLELVALLTAIDTKNEDLRPFLRVVFSSIIITKSGGVSCARDLAHSRPHIDRDKKPKSAISAFFAKGVKSARSMGYLSRDKPFAKVFAGDARKLPLRNDSVDLVVTSPPYANAIDYPRAHKFSLVWLGHSIDAIAYLRPKYIGAERVHFRPSELPNEVEQVLLRVSERDRKKEAIIRQYFGDMQKTLAEVYRVLRRDRAAIVVVGPSTVRKICVPTPQCLAAVGRQLGFEVAGLAVRKLDRDRRMLPVSNIANGNGIELRVHEETVIGFVKRG